MCKGLKNWRCLFEKKYNLNNDAVDLLVEQEVDQLKEKGKKKESSGERKAPDQAQIVDSVTIHVIQGQVHLCISDLVFSVGDETFVKSSISPSEILNH